MLAEKSKGAISTIATQLILAIVAISQIRILSEILQPDKLGSAVLLLGLVALSEAVFFSTVLQVGLSVARDSNTFSLRASLNSIARRKSVLLAATPVLLLYFGQSKLGFGNAEIFSRGFRFAFYVCAGIALVYLDVCRGLKFALLSDRLRYIELAIYQLKHSLLFTGSVLLVATFADDSCGVILGAVVAKTIVVGQDTHKSKAEKCAPVGDFSFKGQTPQRLLFVWLPILYLAILGWCFAFIDRYIAASGVSLVDAAVLAAASGVVNRIYGIISASLTQYYRPQQYLHVRGEWRGHGLLPQTKRWLATAAVAGLATAGALIASADQISNIVISTNLRSGVSSVLPVLCFSALITNLSHALENEFLAKDLGTSLAIIQSTTFLIAVAGMIFGASERGLLGMVAGRAASQAACTVILVGILRYRIG